MNLRRKLSHCGVTSYNNGDKDEEMSDRREELGISRG